MKLKPVTKSLLVVSSILAVTACSSTSSQSCGSSSQNLWDGTKFDGELSYDINYQCNYTSIRLKNNESSTLYNYRGYLVINGERVDYDLGPNESFFEKIYTPTSNISIDESSFEKIMCILISKKDENGDNQLVNACD